MERELLILRHAKSDWGSPSLPDFERPLNKRGEKAALQIGAWMQSHDIDVDAIVSSPALRAQQTIERVCKAIGAESNNIHWDKRLYLADVSTLIEVLAPMLADARCVLVVGHNPGLEDLLITLCGRGAVPQTQQGKLFTTANLARVLLPGDDNPLRSGAGKLLQLVRPKELAEAH